MLCLPYRELWNYSNGPEVKDKKVLHELTVKKIGQCGVDFFGVNMATSKVMKIVADRWLGVSVKKLYGLGMDIESVPMNQVQMILKRISDEAKEIADAWDTISGWYVTTRESVDDTVKYIRTDNQVMI